MKRVKGINAGSAGSLKAEDGGFLGKLAVFKSDDAYTKMWGRSEKDDSIQTTTGNSIYILEYRRDFWEMESEGISNI